MLSGPKASFFEDGVYTFLSPRSSSLDTFKKLGGAQCLKAPTRRLVLAVWSSCGPPPSWCDHETRPESCGWLQQRHFVFVCVCVFSLSTGLDKQQRNTWANTQTSAGVDAGREPVSAWRTARLFVVKEEKVPVLREDGCMGLGLPRTFIRWLRFWVRKRRANGLANTSVQKLALGIIKVSRFWLWAKKWSPFLSNFMKNKKNQNKKTSWNSYS